MAFALVGRILNPVSLGYLQYVENGVLIVADGKIVAFEQTVENLQELVDHFKVAESTVLRLSPHQWVMPGFIDTHIHAPQYPNIGLGYDLPLLEWLRKYTFPLEGKYSDEKFATTVYNAVVRRTLQNGTTTASYYATVHTDSALILANVVLAQKQRGLVGKVNMSMNTSKELLETAERSLSETERFLTSFPKSNIVKPVITPRFALSCDMPTMKGLAKIVARDNLHVQTHISENQSEILAVAEAFPECSSYAGVYGEAGLLTRKTILAHAVFLTPYEIAYIKKKEVGVAHCPNSNTSLQSGLCPVRNLINAGVKVGLGTDCSGGYSPSILDAMRFALSTSIAVSFNRPDLAPLTIAEVMYLATMGGAQVLGYDNEIGNFSVGKNFDALVVDLRINPQVDLLDDNYSFAQLVQKFVHLGDDRNIIKVFVNGEEIVTKA